MIYVLVSIGSAIGGLLRFWLSDLTYELLPETFPYGTLLVNVVGSFILGLIMFYLNEKELIGQNLRIFLAVGFCGGFTTFSTFSLETLNLFRETQYWLATLNVVSNLLFCFLGLYLSYLVSKLIG